MKTKLVIFVAGIFFLLTSLAPASAEPQIWFRSVPEYGDTDGVLKGKVSGVKRKKYRVACYLYVSGGYWSKPYWSTPVVKISKKKKWSCDVTTDGGSGLDSYAVKFIAFLVPRSFSPPLMSGGSVLPSELDVIAVAKAEVDRAP